MQERDFCSNLFSSNNICDGLDPLQNQQLSEYLRQFQRAEALHELEYNLEQHMEESRQNVAGSLKRSEEETMKRLRDNEEPLLYEKDWHSTEQDMCLDDEQEGDSSDSSYDADFGKCDADYDDYDYSCDDYDYGHGDFGDWLY